MLLAGIAKVVDNALLAFVEKEAKAALVFKLK